MNCPQCQQLLREGARFCTRCGFQSGSMPAATDAGKARAPTEPLDERQTADARKQFNTPSIESAPTIGADPLTGQTLDGKYELHGRLGEGGMGSVYRARRTHIGDEVAVKVLHDKFVNDESSIERFRREARAAAQLRHPNVVTIHDYGEAKAQDGAPAYIVMELVDGISLRDVLRREKRLSPERAVALMREICAGVGAAHRRGIIHRDLKPDNVIVTEGDEPGSESVKVVDFGIAKLRDQTATANLTQTGIVVGTPYYMSPEQCRGEHLDARADVYSLAAMLYEMLAGAPPFTAPTVTGVVAKHLTETPPALPADVHAPPALSRVLMRALSKNPDERPADAAAFGRELHAAVEETAVSPRQNAASNVAAPTLPPPVTPPIQSGYNSAAGVSSQAINPNYRTPETVARAQATPQNFQSERFESGERYAPAPTKKSGGWLWIIALSVFVIVGLGAAIFLWAAFSFPDNQNNNADVRPTLRRAVSPTIEPTLQATPNMNSPTATAQIAELNTAAGQLLKPSDLAGLSAPQLRLLRNAVFARHGRIFTDPELRNYFSKQSWYAPNPNYSENDLTPADQANLALIKAAEEGKPLNTVSAATPTPAPVSPAEIAAARNEVEAALNGWLAATRAGDLEAQMRYYAPLVETYYKRSNIPASEVRADRARAYERFSSIDVQATNVSIAFNSSATQATVTFDKTWDFSGSGRRSTGSVRQELQMKKINGAWLITGERDLKVYYSSSS